MIFAGKPKSLHFLKKNSLQRTVQGVCCYFRVGNLNELQTIATPMGTDRAPFWVNSYISKH